jgi:predicted dehydrogenase
MKGAWRQIRSEGGGGALIDMASHLFDLLESFAGPVQGISTRIARQIHHYEVEDSAVSLLEFKSGALATVDSFFCIPDEAVPTRLEIYGSEGAILAEGTIGQGSGGTLRGIFNQGKKGYDAGQKKEAARGYQSLEFPQVNPYTAEFDYFAQCILKKKAPVINGIDNALNITKLVEAAYQSARSGKQVRVRR